MLVKSAFYKFFLFALKTCNARGILLSIHQIKERRGMNNEEMNAWRLLFREEVTDVVHTSEQRLRGVIREEVNAAVYNSEQRLRDYLHEAIKASEQHLRDYLHEAIKASEQRLRNYVNETIAPLKADITTMQGAIASMQGAIASINGSIDLLAVLQRTMQADLARLRADYAQIVLVLDEATIKINELQVSQRALEIKFDEGGARLRDEIHKMLGQIATDFIGLNNVTIQHLEMHEKRTIDQAHPRTYPHSA
jgi:chromosome segregation ATPase